MGQVEARDSPKNRHFAWINEAMAFFSSLLKYISEMMETAKIMTVAVKTER
jgi:hypothetical protein